MARPNKRDSEAAAKMISSTHNLLTKQLNCPSLFYFFRDQRVTLSKVAAISKIFTNKQNLPHLPVPKLSQTLGKYLKSVVPFLNEQELNNTKKLVEKFGLQSETGCTLQKLLVAKAEKTESWLADWWLNVAYLEYRDPVVVYSSPGLVFPFENFQNEGERLCYTAKLILAALDYKLVIDKEKIPVDKMGKDPLDMNQYKKIFGTCRIPGDKRDYLEFNSDSRHIVIVRNNNYFKLEVINKNGEVPSVSQLACQLQSIMEESVTVAPAVGILTSENRDTWFKAYQNLTKDKNNKQSVEEIEKSLFLVALDNPMPEVNDSAYTLASKQFIHGGGSRGNSGNRWFDKTIQFVIGEDGTVGLTYEHSPSEGQPIAVIADYLVNYIKGDAYNKLPDIKMDNGLMCLPFNVNDQIEKDIQQAKCNIDKLAENLDMDAFKFDSYGKEFVKSQKLSPDSYLQMAMQYAFYRVHKVPGAHYESAATRKYIHGRTETIRSCSVESIAFAKTMLDNKKSDNDKVEALKNAINAHKTYSIEAVNGFGVDRHLLGLKLIALENCIQLPDLYKDPSYVRSTYMRISSSQVATKSDGFMCYGPLTPDGYACCYNPRPNDINIAVAAFTAHKDTSAKKFREALEESLHDMHNILVRTQKCKL